MSREQMRRTAWSIVVLALAITLGGVAAYAAPLAPAATLAPVPGEPDPTGFSAVTAPLVGPFSVPAFTGTVLSRVWTGDPSNPFGGLTFTYEIQNAAGSANSIARLALSSFAGFSVDASWQTPAAAGRAIPALVDRDVTGDVVGFSFSGATGGTGQILPGQMSVLLVLQTNANNFQPSMASVINGGTASALVYVPIPEPASLGLISLISLIGLAGLRRRG